MLKVEEWKEVEKSLKLELGAEELYSKFLTNIKRNMERNIPENEEVRKTNRIAKIHQEVLR